MFSPLPPSRTAHSHAIRTLALAMLAGLPATALAGPGNDYCVVHNFRITTPGNAVPIVNMAYSDHVRARTNKCNDTGGGPKDLNGSVPIGIGGPLTKHANSIAPASFGDAYSKATVTTLAAGIVAGTIEASGSVTPSLAGCPPPAFPRGFGRAFATSKTMVTAHGQKADRSGHISLSGTWHTSGTVSGTTLRAIGQDPVIAHLHDLTTGITTDYTLLSIEWSAGAGAGSFDWDGVKMSNTAPDFDLNITMNSPVTVQQGTLRYSVRGGVVNTSLATGVFAGMGFPPAGGPGAFAIPLPSIEMDYDLGGDPTHDLQPDFDFDNAGVVEKVITGNGITTGNGVITSLGTGAGNADLSEITLPDITMGYGCSLPLNRCAVLLPAPGPVPIELTALSLTSYGAVPQAAFVRIWNGFPGVGAPIAGDLVTDRLMETEDIRTYRVQHGNPLDTTRPLRDVYVDLSWVPPLPPGQYWIEFATMGQTPSAQTFAVQSPSETHVQDSMQFDAQLNQWHPTMDQGSGRLVSLAVNVYSAASNSRPPCYANCDGSQTLPVLNVADFTCFLQKYALNDSYANCDGSTAAPVLNVADFTCFLQQYANGCP